MARGSNSYKERHWNQRHQNERNTNFQTLIVPEHHIKAQELLKRGNVRPAECEADNVPPNEDDEPRNEDLTATGNVVYLNTTTSPNSNNSGDESGDDHSDDHEDYDGRSQVSRNSLTPSVDIQPTASSAQKSIQTTVNTFFKACESEKTEESSLDKVQDTVNKILVKLDELTLVSTPNKSTDHTRETVNIDDIKAAHNILELANSEKITIETLNDGCRITCVTCKEYIQAMPHMNM